MKKTMDGFTLIELLMVLLILGVLAAIAVPKFVNLEGSARQVATDGIASALGSGSAINFAARSAGNKDDTVAVDNCNTVAKTLQGGLDENYSIESLNLTQGDSKQCKVIRSTGEVATFTGHGIE